MRVALGEFILFLRHLRQSRHILFELAKRDFKSRYLGSYLGLVWAFLQPALTTLIFWFVFAVGLRVAAVGEFPFILLLLTGLTPWFFFAESLLNSTQAVRANASLVTNVVFRTSILPIAKLLSGLIIHLFFILLITVLCAAYGFGPSLHQVQVLYYLCGLLMLLLGLSWATSSLIVFLKDLGPAITLMLQFGFWLVPIVWPLERVPARYHWLFKLNPMFYIVQGYRDCFLHKAWFWEHPLLSIYFWCATLSLLAAGALIFRKLRPHFGDML